jgi:hypothetical protein
MNLISYLFLPIKSLIATVSGSEKGLSPGQKSPHNSVVFFYLSGNQSTP